MTFAEEFSNLKAYGLNPQCFDVSQSHMIARQRPIGGWVFDAPDRIDSIAILAPNLVTVTGFNRFPLGYYNRTFVGSFPDDGPAWKHLGTGLLTWCLTATPRLKAGRYSATDAKSNVFAIIVHGSEPIRYEYLPPTLPLQYLTEFSSVTPPPLVPSWVDQVCRGINVRA